MTGNWEQDEIVQIFTRHLLNILKERQKDGPLSYGFEYEFLPKKQLSIEQMKKIYDFLPEHGFTPTNGCFASPTGMSIEFEPGGQIEYISSPLYSNDDAKLRQFMMNIQETNKAILQELDIEYLAIGYIPGRANAPLCLMDERYKNLHARMLKSGTRGREMMKGTASIHLHVAIRNIHELVPLYYKLCALSTSKEFKMSADRRDIWNNTDPSRCGLPSFNFISLDNPEQLIEELVRFALNAEDISENRPLWEKRDLDFDLFLYHLTTIFTDVRINLKGPTLELRTLDSIPLQPFEQKWKIFISSIESIAYLDCNQYCP